MESLLRLDAALAAVPIQRVRATELDRSLQVLGAFAAEVARGLGFEGKAGQLALLPDQTGRLTRVLFGVGAGRAEDLARARELPSRLPPGDYTFGDALEAGGDRSALAWAQGAYEFDRFKHRAAEHERPAKSVLRVGPEVDLPSIQRLARACALARDMINSPASHMGPQQLETIAREIAQDAGARATVIVGDALIEANYPAVHAVGRAAASDRAPRLIELDWTSPLARPDAPTVVLVGKGVTFDTGGLDLKPSAGMRLMKKDMGGAAHALALTRLVMEAGLPIRLVTLVPAVENAVSGDAVRPGDVLDTRAGLTVEVGNTDAEGRLILADALTRAGELAPTLTIDLATLTGAARVALGPQVIPFYTPSDALAAGLAAASEAVADPLWRMPLWAGYASSLESDVADLKNDPDAWAQAGSVTAALFLQRFAPTSGEWVHFDIFAWNPKSAPGRPVGAEAQAIRALFHLLQARYPAPATDARG